MLKNKENLYFVTKWTRVQYKITVQVSHKTTVLQVKDLTDSEQVHIQRMSL